MDEPADAASRAAARLPLRLKDTPSSVWLMLLFIAAAVFYYGVETGGFNLPLTRLPWSILVPVSSGFCLLHSTLTFGWRRAAVLLALCVTLAFVSEYVGQVTGAIFGPYYYTGLLGLKLFGRIPVLIPFAWYMMFYPTYIVANILAEGTPITPKMNAVWIVWMAALSALVMTAWDLTMDPIMSYDSCHGGGVCGGRPLQSQIGSPAWVWPHGGDYFGVPFLNFRGWLMTAFIVFLVFRFIEPRLKIAPWRGAQSKLMLWLPVGLYGGMAAIDSWLGRHQITDIHLISPFAMGIPAMFASFHIFTKSDYPMWPHHDRAGQP